MNRITHPIRVRVLEAVMRMLGHAVVACAQQLRKAGVSVPDIAPTCLSENGVEHPDIAIERPLVLQVLEGREPCSRSELEIALGDVEPLAIGDALQALEAEGVLCVSGERVWASRCICHLDKLGLIGV